MAQLPSSGFDFNDICLYMYHDASRANVVDENRDRMYSQAGLSADFLDIDPMFCPVIGITACRSLYDAIHREGAIKAAVGETLSDPRRRDYPRDGGL